MLLVMDIGNSHTVLGLYEGDALREHWRVVTSSYRTSDELRVLLLMLMRSADIDPASISGCCISSVVPQLNLALEQVCEDAFAVSPLMVQPGVKTGPNRLLLQLPEQRRCLTRVTDAARKAVYRG